MFVAALAGSALVHGLSAMPLKSALERLIASGHPPELSRKPVEVVRLDASEYQSTLDRARAASARLSPELRQKRAEARMKAKEAEKKKPEEEEDPNPKGQIVEVPAGPDKRRPDDARFLAKENSRVEKETVARAEMRDESRKRVTNRLQDSSSNRQSSQKGMPVPGLSSDGNGGDADAEGTSKGKGEARDRKLKLELPKMSRRDLVELGLVDLPDPTRSSVREQKATEEMKGTGKRLRLGTGKSDQEAADGGGKRGARSGLPSLSDLRPTLGTIAKLRGSPSSDYVEDVPEGDGTFLNTRSFKYATYFYQVRDSVRPHWAKYVQREMRRRDPTGDVYGPGNLKTHLHIRLDDSGKVSNVRVAESSGVGFLDELAVNAFRKAEAFPNPPKGIIEDDGSINFSFTFVLTTGSRGPLDIFR